MIKALTHDLTLPLWNELACNQPLPEPEFVLPLRKSLLGQLPIVSNDNAAQSVLESPPSEGEDLPG